MFQRIKNLLCQWLCPKCGPDVPGDLVFSGAIEVKVQRVTVTFPAYDATDVKKRTFDVNLDGSDLPTVELAADQTEAFIDGEDGESFTAKLSYFDKAGNSSFKSGSGAISDVTPPAVPGEMSFSAAVETEVP